MKFFGILRVDDKDEDEGLDLSHHGSTAYNMSDIVSGDKKYEVRLIGSFLLSIYIETE